MTFKGSLLRLLPRSMRRLVKGQIARTERNRKLKALKKHTVSKRQLMEDFRRLGLKSGDVVLVHSSLTSIGFVEGGADTVVDALMEVIGGEGLLAMPCLSLMGSMAETLRRGLTFDPRSTPSTVGAITETFRKRGDVHRSVHPTHSVCAWGKRAERLVSGHESASTTFGPGTPWHRIVEEDGIIVGLGINLGPVTPVHIVEDSIPDFPVDVYYSEPFAAKVTCHDGRELVMSVRAHNPQVSKTRIDHEDGRWIRSFFTEYLSNTGVLKTGHVGQASCWSMRARDLVKAQKQLMKQGITIYTTEEQYRLRAQR